MPLVNKTFSDIITFTRASTATYFDSAGVLQSAAIDVPRLDYDPATLAARGLLIEEQRTNLVTYSEQFDDPAWTTTNATISANTIVSPDGTVDADSISETNATGSHRVRTASISVSASTSYTCTVFAKLGFGSVRYLGIGLSATTDLTTGSRRSYVFDLSNGAVTTTGGSTWTLVSGSATAVGNGWYRCQITVTTDAAASTMVVSIGLSDTFSAATFASGYTGDGTSGLYIWGAQLEAGAFPTSYIPTTTTALTRSADVASVDTLSPWYNQTEGTFFTQFSRRNIAVGNVFGQDTTTSNNGYGVTKGSTGIVSALNADGLTDITLGTSSADIDNVALGYSSAGFSGSWNGAAAVVSTAAPTRTPISLILGNNRAGTSNINGYLRRITYYPRRLSNAELVSITS